VRYSARKVPLTTAGRAASSTDPATWADHATVRDSDAGVGAGFVLNGDGIACIDLDHCLDDGELAAWAAEILASLPPTYTEVSPSGTGLHVWGLATVGTGRKIRRDGTCVEVYDRARYVTVTGRRYGAARSLADIGEVAASLR
jgi:primase-polymerase (primpol)-like protein